MNKISSNYNCERNSDLLIVEESQSTNAVLTRETLLETGFV